MPPLRRVIETCLYVADLDRTETFYRTVLGLAVIGRDAGRYVFFAAGDTVLLAFSAAATRDQTQLPAHGTTGPGHFAFEIAPETVDDWRRHLEERGVAVDQEQTWSRPEFRSLYFRDPDGHSVELITPGAWQSMMAEGRRDL